MKKLEEMSNEELLKYWAVAEYQRECAQVYFDEEVVSTEEYQSGNTGFTSEEDDLDKWCAEETKLSNECYRRGIETHNLSYEDYIDWVLVA